MALRPRLSPGLPESREQFTVWSVPQNPKLCNNVSKEESVKQVWVEGEGTAFSKLWQIPIC